jgi:hypothetical protein
LRRVRGNIAQFITAALMASAAPAFAGDASLITLHGGGGAGSTEFGTAEDDVGSGFIGGTLSFGPLIVTGEQNWMSRDFEFGGNADFSTLTGAAALQLLTTDYVGIAAHTAYADGSIDFEIGGDRDYTIFRVGGDVSINFAKILGLDLESSGVGLYGSSGYVEIKDGFAPSSDMSGFYSTTGASFQATDAMKFCVDGGYANLSGDGAPDSYYWEAGGGIAFDVSEAVGMERSGAALHGDLHYGEIERSDRHDESFTFQAGASFAFGSPIISRSAVVAITDSARVEGCDFGALVPMIDRRLKLNF